jgi:hypothetical protein
MQQDASFQRIFEEAKDIYEYLKAAIYCNEHHCS